MRRKTGRRCPASGRDPACTYRYKKPGVALQAVGSAREFTGILRPSMVEYAPICPDLLKNSNKINSLILLVATFC